MRPVDDKRRITPVSRVPRVRHTPPAADESDERPPAPEPKPGGARRRPRDRRGRVDEYV